MAYIGNQPTIGQYRKLDDISGSFNGSLTAFTMQVSSTNVSAGSAFQLLISLGGVIQEPGTDFTVSGSTITFTTAPAASLSFFGIMMGQALNTATPGDSTVTGAKIVDGTITGGKLAAAFNYDSGLLVLDDTNDRVGIGTTTPLAELEVQGATTPEVMVRNTTTSSFSSLHLAEVGDSGGTFVVNRLGSTSTATGGARAGQIWNSANAPIVFGTNGTERLRIGTDGSLQLRNSTGIDFSQIQTNASGMTSETLDSYEEGTWDPVYNFSTSGDATVVSAGRYIKIGSLVHIQGYVYINSTNSLSGNVLITGLPFSSSSSPSQRVSAFAISQARAWPADEPDLRLLLEPNSTGIKMFNNATNASSNARLTNANFTANLEKNIISFSGAYTV